MLHKARTLFVSDVHLGTPSSQAAHLLRLLDEVSVDQLVLVGDIIDLTSMQARAWWHPLHTACVQRVLKLAREGTKVVYVPGNHDAELRQHVGCEIQGVRIERTVDYRALDGSIYRVAHGDEFDRTGKGHAPWIEALGESLYEVITWMNRVYNQARCSFDLEYHPVSLDIKKRVRRAMAFIEAFENRVIEGTKPLPVDGYICGHIHFANIRRDGGVAYLNTGDWVEHCSTIVEPLTGGFELWHVAGRARHMTTLAPDWWRQEHVLPSAA